MKTAFFLLLAAASVAVAQSAKKGVTVVVSAERVVSAREVWNPDGTVTTEPVTNHYSVIEHRVRDPRQRDGWEPGSERTRIDHGQTEPTAAVRKAAAAAAVNALLDKLPGGRPDVERVKASEVISP